MDQKTIKILTDAILKIKREDGFSLLTDIGRYLKEQDKSYIPSNYGGRTWKKIIEQYPTNFQLSLHPNKKSTPCIAIIEKENHV